MTKFNFVVSGYNNDDYAMRSYLYNDSNITLLDTIVFDNPSYCISYKDIVFTYTKHPLYMVALRVVEGKFVELDKIPLGLGSMTHLTYSEKNKCLFGASYLDGCMCKLDFDGEKFSNLKIISHKELYGEDSKCHCIITNEDESKVLCVNIQTSALYIYDTELNLIKIIQLHEGCGPRHAIYHNNLIYVVTEYSNEVIVVDEEKGAIQYITTLSSECESYGGTLFYKDGYIFASNRGEETIAKFKVLDNGMVKYVNSFPVNGIHSRHMIYEGDLIISLNMNSNHVSFISANTEKEVCYLEYPNSAGIAIIK